MSEELLERERFTYQGREVRIDVEKSDFKSIFGEEFDYRMTLTVDGTEELDRQMLKDEKQLRRFRKGFIKQAKRWIKNNKPKVEKVPLDSIPAVRKMNAQKPPRGLAAAAEKVKFQEREEFPSDYHKIKSFVSK